MRPLHLPLSAFLLALIPLAALAQSASSSSSSSSTSNAFASSSRSSSISSWSDDDEFHFGEINLGRYSDAPWDHVTNVSVSALTRAGILRGNDDGTFTPQRRLNRAEFVTIVMRLLTDNRTVATNCFPDVSRDAWYAEDVCRAKFAGLVRGNAVAGVPESQWRFEPTRDIQYEEAVKILVTLYALPIVGDTEGMNWYVPFVNAAKDSDLDITGLAPGDRITRGEMARLTAGFAAEASGQLEELRDAERMSSSSRTSSRSSSSRSSMSSTSSRSSSSMSSSSRSSMSSVSDTTVRSHILLLGQLSPAIAAANFFSSLEPVDIRDLDITLASGVTSIQSILVYDEFGTQIATASRVNGSNTQFHADIPFGSMLLPYKEERHIYLRARLKSDSDGGQSGEDLRVTEIEVTGEGRWSSEEYGNSTSETFPTFETALARITSIENAGEDQGGAVIGGPGRTLGEFIVTAETPESLHPVRLTSLTFTAEMSNGISLSNVMLRNADGSASTSCSVSFTIITCSGIDQSIGIVDMTRTMRLVGDVAIDSSFTGDLFLRMVIDQPGTPSTSGAITWTDGETTFTWVDFNQPVVRGAMYE